MSFEVRVTLATPVGISGVIEVVNYSYSEQSSPMSGGDSTGSVGGFSITLPTPDTGVSTSIGRHTLWGYLRALGANVLYGATVNINDSRKGFTSGTINKIETSSDGATITASGTTRLSLVNVYNIQAQPYSGTLNGAVTYYLGLAGITTGFTVDSTVASTPVIIPGWNGELWLYLKQLMTAVGCDISLVSNVILVRPVRLRIAASDRDIDRSFSIGGSSLAQAVEVWRYNNRTIVNQPVYPPTAPTLEDRVLNVNAGESAEYTLELSASLSNLVAPNMITSMAPDYYGSSAYVVTGNDGIAIDPIAWTNSGGRVDVSLNPDTTSVTVKLQGPIGMVRTDNGEPMTSFSLSLEDAETGNRYSTMRLSGSGVAFTRTVHRVPTGIPPSMAATDIGATIDNPFVSSVNDVARVGLRAAREYAGKAMTLSGSVVSINRRGDTGQASLPTYAQVQAAITAAIGGTPTYQQVQNYHTGLGLTTYAQVQQYWKDRFANTDVDQVFGNVQGARIYDKQTRRWYRIRSANLTPGGISFSDAEDDLTYDDFQGKNTGMTYSTLQAKYAGYNYRMVELAGLI